MSLTQKLTQLRELMHKHQLDYYFVPAADAHNNEYVPATWQRRAFISGFTGSAGDALIGQEHAYLWTDARYFLQAEKELASNLYTLMKQQQGAAPIDVWLMQHTQHKNIGVDPKVMSIAQAQKWQTALHSKQGKLVAIEANLIDQIWSECPALSSNPIKVQPLEYAGLSTQHKIIKLQQELLNLQADAHVVTMLDAIAWLFNIRGSDVQYNPLVISYAIITPQSATLFIDIEKTSGHTAYFKEQNIILAPYTAFATALNNLTGTVLVDPTTTSWWVQQQLQQATLKLAPSPITLMKAIKNPAEQRGMIDAHRHDAIAMLKFLHWLENNWFNQTELSAAQTLEKFRRENSSCLDLSFDTISGYAAHGAIIHYRATPATNCHISNESLYLVDSGGQYVCGTTDVTRTIHLGTPTADQRRHYTLVLKGHLALRHAIFPDGTCGEHLDALAHQFLWQHGLDYGHGTGHGVGCYLCVHEGPQRISKATTNVKLIPGMAVSNEPGVYFPDQYGIRIENVCLVTEHSPTFYTFSDLTLVPYAHNLIDKTLLTRDEINWINEYHANIYSTLAPSLSLELRNWLKLATEPLSNCAH